MANKKISKLKFNKVTYDLADESSRAAISNLEGKLEATRADLNNMRAAVGSPLTAATTSAMTDKTKIYVYTGTTTTVSGVTYIQGHWYFHNGSKWTDGGEYNQKTGTLGYVTPEMFGAKADGVTDDSLALAAALEAAGEGGMVMLKPPGIYLVTETLHMLDRQTLEGNGATIIWNAPLRDKEDGTKEAPPIILAQGSLEVKANGDPLEYALFEPPKVVANPASSSRGEANEGGFVHIKVIAAEKPNYNTGDRIFIQAARPAMQPESGDYWCGTSTGAGSQTWWAEVLVVNNVSDEPDSNGAWTIRCIGSLTYPYYLPEPEEGVDKAVALTDVINASTKKVVAYYKEPTSEIYNPFTKEMETIAPPLARPASTVRKINFLRDVTVRNLKVEGNGESHTGDTSSSDEGAFTAYSGGNTMRMTLCEGGGFENVSIRLTDMGRGFYLTNCWKTEFRNCRYEANYKMYAVVETHAITNAFTFASCWSCLAEGCYSLRAGQSFDTTYQSNKDFIACPSLYISVRNCTVEQAMDSAATNHSGAWGQVFEGCRFIDCTRPVAIRSPLTRIRGCVFSGTGGAKMDLTNTGHDINRDVQHLIFTEPTIWGCSVEDCTFVGGIAVVIQPYVVRTFNYDKGNYINPSGPIPTGDDPAYKKRHMVTNETIVWPHPPERKALGIRISGNTFHSCNGALWVKTATRWNNDSTGAATDYAQRDLGVDFMDNTLSCCGAHYYPVYVGHAANGCRISGNRFIDCVSLDPSYVTSTGRNVTVNRLIYISQYNVRMEVRNNIAERCGGGFRYLVGTATTAPLWLGTDGRPELSIGGNRVLSDNDAGVTIYNNSGTESRSVEYAQDKRSVAVRGMAGGDSGLVTGYRYSWADGTFDLLAEDDPLVSVDSGAVWHQGTAGNPECLVRTWFYLQGNKATLAKWRTAVFDYPVDADTFARLCACWDKGKDETGATVTFASTIKLVETSEEIDPETGTSETTARVETYAPPLNANMEFIPFGVRPYIGGDPMYSANAATGVITVNVPKASAPDNDTTVLYAYPTIPAGMEIVPRQAFTVCTEVKATKLNGNIRLNAQGGWHPSLFAQTLLITDKDLDEPAQGTGKIYVWRARTTASGLLDLGKADSPWKDIHAKTLSLGSAQVTENQLQDLLALLE